MENFDPSNASQRKQLSDDLLTLSDWIKENGNKLLGLKDTDKSIPQIANDLSIASILVRLSSFE